MVKKVKWFKTGEKGSLKEVGYDPDKPIVERSLALDRAVESPKHTGKEVWHKLDGLAKVTKRTQPKNSKIYRSDANYVKAKYIVTTYWSRGRGFSKAQKKRLKM